MLARRLGAGTALALALVVTGATAASAHDCVNPNRNTENSGAIAGTLYVATDTFVPSGAKGNPTSVKVVLPNGEVVYSFSHSGGAKHDYVIPGAKGCDGKGLDAASACLGG